MSQKPSAQHTGSCLGTPLVLSNCCRPSNKSTGHLVAPPRTRGYVNLSMPESPWESSLNCMVLGSMLRNAESVGKATGRGI